MFAFHFSRDGSGPPEGAERRLTASLAIGGYFAFAAHEVGGAVFASRVASPAHARRWRPHSLADGRQLLFSGYLLKRAEMASALNVAPGLDDVALYGAARMAWGEGAEDRLVGHYAALIWDAARRRLELARSPLRAPPLHIWLDDQRIMVGTAARLLFATGEVRQELDEQKLADALFLNFAEEERGWFRHVRRLPLGSHGVIEGKGGLRTRRHFDPAAVSAIRFRRDEDYVEAARALMDEAAAETVKGAARPAIMLSGGLDSQAVAAQVLRQQPEKPLLSYTSVPEAGWDGYTSRFRFGDERAHVEAFAALYPTLRPRFLDCAGVSPQERQDATFLLGGFPPRNVSNMVWLHEVHRAARQDGADLLLVGTGGNASFSFDGKGAYPGWFKRGQWGRLWRELAALGYGETGMARRFAAHVLMPLLPLSWSDRIAARRHRSGMGTPLSRTLMNPDFAQSMQVQERMEAMMARPVYPYPSSTYALRSRLLLHGFAEGGDIMMMLESLHGLPTRDPTLYRPMVEFCMGIPDDQYLRDAQPRWLARRMLDGVVPDMVLHETRRGLQSADWHVRMSRDVPAMKAELEHLAASPGVVQCLNVPLMRRLLDEWPAETPRDLRDTARFHLALGRAMAAARFIRFVEGGNG